MRLTILILLIKLSLSSFSQHYIDSTFYANGKLQSFASYDSLHKYWRYYRLYETGQIESAKRLDPIHLFDTDTSIIYHRNGKVAWIFPYADSGFLKGKLTGYYQDGSIKREAYYYRSFRIGTWKEYYEDGKLKSVSCYEITHSDSVFYQKITSEDYKNGFVETERFTWDDIDTTIVHKEFHTGNRSFETSTLISKKIGIWETYDPSGKVITSINYKKRE